MLSRVISNRCSAVILALVFASSVFFVVDPAMSSLWDVEIAVERDSESESLKEGQEKEKHDSAGGLCLSSPPFRLLEPVGALSMRQVLLCDKLALKLPLSRGPPRL
jgi:hypothetical protein